MTELAPILERLTAALERPAIPLEKQLWDAKHVASYLGVKVRTVTDNYRFVPGFPECFRLPSENGLGGLRWKASKVMQWADRQG